MKAIEISAYGGPEVLRLVERPEPVAGTGELLIQVLASGINRPDVLQRRGLYPAPAGASDIPGLEVAGTVLSGDADAMRLSGIERGDVVCALVSGGGYAERCVAPVGQCLPLPPGLNATEAASLPETCFTVWSNLFDRARYQPQEWLMVHGGSSGIGVTAIQMAKAHGGRVIVTVGSQDKVQACLAIGADHAINYRETDFVTEVQRLTHGMGVDVIIDMVAGGYVSRNLECLALDGRVVTIAVQGGSKAEVDMSMILRKRLTLSGSTLRSRSVAFKAEIAGALRSRVWPWIAQGSFKPVIHQIFPATQAGAAHALMESNQHIGKLVLSW